MKRLTWLCAAAVIAALLAPAAAFADEDERSRELGLKAEAALKRLYAAVPDAEVAFQKSVGWAYFEMQKLGEGADVFRGAGNGVAMTAGSRSGIPMSVNQNQTMEQKFEYLFFFRTKEAFDTFVDGWEGGDSMKAAERRAGLKPDDPFVLGIKAFMLVEAGPVEEANIWTTQFKKGFSAQ
jgi:hypothetical protein